MAFYNAYCKLFNSEGDNYRKAYRRARIAAHLTTVVIIAAVVVSFVSVVFGLCYIDNVANLKRFEAAKVTVYQARVSSRMTDLERISISRNIISYNSWLAEAKYYAGLPILKLAYPDEYLTAEPIK